MKASDLTNADIGKRVRVTIEGMVGVINASNVLPVFIQTDGGEGIWLRATAEVEIIPSKLKVGDRVMVSGYDQRATLLAIDGTEAWVKWDKGFSLTMILSRLTPIPFDEVKS